jgi:pimeloyl-ACP methyl ester carboxylesterase
LLAVHHPGRVLTLTAIMTTPMGADPGPAWARARAGQAADPTGLPPPAPLFFRHLARLTAAPPATREDRIAAAVETLRVINGTALPFQADEARRYAETAYDRASDYAAALHHDQAGRRMTSDRLAPLLAITAPVLVIHGTDDPLLPPAHGRALAALIPGARFQPVPGMGHGFYSPGLPRRIAGMILAHTVTA